MTQTHPTTGAVMFHHGGSYKLSGSNYTEKVEFANQNTANMINRELPFTVTLTSDTLTQTGFQPGSGSSGASITEVWKRVPPGMQPVDVAKAAGASVAITAVTGRLGPPPVARGAGPLGIESGTPGPSVALSLTSKDPKVQEALQAGEAAIRTRQFDAAVDAFKRANTLANKSSAVALYGLSRAYHALGAFKSEAETCAEALKHVGTDRLFAALLHNQRGMALAAQAAKNNEKLLVEAEAAFRTAFDLDPTVVAAKYNLGVALLRQGKDDEGKAVLAQYVETNTPGPDLVNARRLIENPRRARENYAADYRATTFDGQYIASDDLLGKTVLLDFWGTWCPPCLAATPDLVKLHRKFAGDGFVMLGVSSDQPTQEAAVKEYVAKHKMDWPQNLDQTRQVHNAFQVRVFPTYIVIDREGIVRERVEGWSGSTIGRLERAIQASLKAAPK
jgi:peroxiredoxin